MGLSWEGVPWRPTSLLLWIYNYTFKYKIFYMSDKILLSDMIQTLRGELEQAQLNAKGSKFKFTVDTVELELSVELTKGGEGSGGIKFWVVEAGGKYQQSDASMHKFKLVLKPGTADGKALDVGNEGSSKTSNK